MTSGTATVTVNDGSTAQTWEGFGGAFNEKGWSYLSMLSQTDRDSAMHLLFGSDGARFNMGRIPMGASDYAISRYTDDEVASGSTDYAMASFSISRDIAVHHPVHQGGAGGERRHPVLGQPLDAAHLDEDWAPRWTTSPFDGENMTDNAQILTAHAQYFVKFVQSIPQQGITIEAVAPQNEPNYSENYPSCLWTAALFTKFVGQYLGPGHRQRGAHHEDHARYDVEQRQHRRCRESSTPSWPTPPPRATSRCSAISGTMKGNVASANSSYHLPVWQTEHQCGNYPWVSG